MRTFASKAGWILAALLAITLVASWTGVISAGDLDPPSPIGSTMKSLDDIPGSWSRDLSSTGGCNSERFDCVLPNDQGVLDRETGLVWQRSVNDDTKDWDSTFGVCYDRNPGGKWGWRVPTVNELLSLHVEATLDGLPADHPFQLAPAVAKFWSSTRNTASAGRSMSVDMSTGAVADDLVAQPHRLWCVRGPGGGDIQ